MKKKIILRSIIVILIILNSFAIYVLARPNSKEVLEDVKISDILKNKDKTLSIMLQEDGDETTFKEADNRDKWPDTASYIFDKAECTDSEGNSIDYKSILTFDLDKKTTTVKAKQTVYCTLYFVKGKETLTLLQSKAGFQEKSGMYRFVGTSSTVQNNYICFGTIDKTECLGSPDKYMYRIIGLTKDGDTTIGLHAGQLKLIKAVPSSTSQAWGNSASDTSTWDSSEIFKYLNTTFINTIKNDSNGTYWNKLITSQNWYIQDQTSTPRAIEEPTGEKTVEPSQVGLMYATDFANASTGTNSWLFIKNGWSTNSSLSGDSAAEWTMSRYGEDTGWYFAWSVHSGGTLSWGNGQVNYWYSVRPVFYLKPGILLTGDGTTTNPFRIAG